MTKLNIFKPDIKNWKEKLAYIMQKYDMFKYAGVHFVDGGLLRQDSKKHRNNLIMAMHRPGINPFPRKYFTPQISHKMQVKKKSSHNQNPEYNPDIL